MIEPPAALYTGSQSDFRLGKGPYGRYRRRTAGSKSHLDRFGATGGGPPAPSRTEPAILGR
jgi:hypothetical protein